MADNLDMLIARPPAMQDFVMNGLAGLADPFIEARRNQQRKAALTGLPVTPQGTPDYSQATLRLMQLGDLEGAKTLGGLANNDFDRLYKMGMLGVARKQAERKDFQIVDVGTPDGRKVKAVVNPIDGKVTPIGSPMGEENKLSPGDRKAILEAEDAIPNLDQTVATLRRAKELNPQTFTGYGAGMRGAIGSKLPDWMVPDAVADPKRSEATAEWQNIMGLEAIKLMSESLKGATTNFELQEFQKKLADPSTPPEVRGRIIDRMITLAERQKQLTTERINQMRGGTYFKPGGGQSTAPQAATSAPGASPKLPPGTTPQTAIAEARAALQRGAPREAVIQRLQQLGITAPGL